MSAKRFSTRSAPTRTCSSTAAGCGDGCPSMLGGDERRMRMAYSLAFSLPGTPVLFYGEEIGMAENLDIPGRLAVRTPMQWTGGANGGFSTAAKRRLTRPLPDGLLRAGPRQRRRPAPRP